MEIRWMRRSKTGSAHGKWPRVSRRVRARSPRVTPTACARTSQTSLPARCGSNSVESWLSSPLRQGSLAREGVHHVADEALKRLVLHELLVHLRVVLQEVLHHHCQRLVVRHARSVRRVLLRVLVGSGGHGAHCGYQLTRRVRFEHVPDPSTPRRFRPFRFFPKLEAKTRLYLTARQRRIRNRLRIGILAREHASFTTVENVI